MVRFLGNLLTVLSLLLMGATLIVVTFVGEIRYFGHRPQWMFSTERGRIGLYQDYKLRWEIDTRWLLLPGVVVPLTRALVIRYLRHAAYRRTLRRRWAGLCIACGYDLRRTQQRCPECGAEYEKLKFST